LCALRLAAARLWIAGPGVRLHAREEQVLACLEKGMTYKEAAGALGMSIPLLKKVVQRAFGRLHAHGRIIAINKWRAGE
jgi:DNA-binding CsgD family transcriptional regulator